MLTIKSHVIQNVFIYIHYDKHYLEEIYFSDRPFCIHDIRRQHRIPGTNILIVVKFYSKPTFSAISFRKNDSELNIGDIGTVSLNNISLDVYNVTIITSGYELIINITEFSEEDIGNYFVHITNDFGYCNCIMQLLFEGKQYFFLIHFVTLKKNLDNV